jgi:hypothetical protein
MCTSITPYFFLTSNWYSLHPHFTALLHLLCFFFFFFEGNDEKRAAKYASVEWTTNFFSYFLFHVLLLHIKLAAAASFWHEIYCFNNFFFLFTLVLLSQYFPLFLWNGKKMKNLRGEKERKDEIWFKLWKAFFLNKKKWKEKEME